MLPICLCQSYEKNLDKFACNFANEPDEVVQLHRERGRYSVVSVATTNRRGYDCNRRSYANSGRGHANSRRGYAQSGRGYAYSGRGYDSTRRSYANSRRGHNSS